MSIELKLALDGCGATATLPGGHTLNIPLNEHTGAVLESILIAQQSTPKAKLGSRAVPLQEMVRDYMARGGQIKRIEPAKAQGAPARSERGTLDISIEELFDLNQKETADE